MPIKTRKHVSLQFKDAAGSPLTRTIGPGPGDFTFDGLEEANVEALPVYNRGTFYELVAGDDKQIAWSATIYDDGDQTGTSVLDAALKTGDWASATTQDPGGVVFTQDVIVTVTRGAVTNTYTLNNCRTVAKYTETKEGNTWSFSGTCYQGVTVG
jgi:hypothetical protein